MMMTEQQELLLRNLALEIYKKILKCRNKKTCHRACFFILRILNLLNYLATHSIRALRFEPVEFIKGPK